MLLGKGWSINGKILCRVWKLKGGDLNRPQALILVHYICFPHLTPGKGWHSSHFTIRDLWFREAM